MTGRPPSAAGRGAALWRRGLAVVACLLVALGLAGSPPARAQPALTFGYATAAARPVLQNLRLGEHPDRTRLVAEMSSRVEFTLHLLADPYRLVIDLPAVDWQGPALASLGGVGLVDGIERSPDALGVTRLVVRLTGPARVRDAFFLGQTASIPYRLVLDLEPVSAEDFQAASLTADDAADPPGEVTVPLPAAAGGAAGAPSHRPTVVIDPGHGGVDPGAIGADGTLERTVTLAVAEQLRDLLAAGGRYDVVMTRANDDEYVGLRERVRRSRDAGADLFVSIHADANPSRSVRGASIYTLSDTASDREAAMLAARENRADVLGSVELQADDDVMTGILIDLVQRRTHTHSNAMAEFLVNRMAAVAPLLVNTHREAGFAVLTAPDVPSVLIELGHISNPLDEQMLTDPIHQALLADALRRGIDDYFDWRAMVDGQ
ncbi:MAG: N-acetylmuramoyl-L-alanine amidase [Rhodospirillaceae bacterium]|nr:N-acetylmuramoyl-L-alanine amidase [Rhodospirillaceae bacterium]MCA8934137.1 N-acetylmuramoyl-L-alanine amidase [Rhodospirillaceae bacterium]